MGRILTTGVGKRTAWRERLKSINRAKEAKAKMEKEILNLTGRENIEYEIRRLESEIINCKYDLQNFKDNELIKNKLQIAERELMIKKELLKNLDENEK